MDKKILAVLILALGLIGSVSWMVIQNRQKTLKTAQFILHSKDVLFHSEEAMTLALEVQDGSRGFALTGDDIFLEPFRSSVKTFNQHLDALKTLTKDEPLQQQRVKELDSLIQKKIRHSDTTIRLRKEQGLQAAGSFIALGRGEKNIDQIRHLVNEIQVSENESLTDKTAKFNQSLAGTNNWFMALNIIMALILISVIIIIWRSSGAKARAEAELASSRRFLESVIENIPNMIFVKDAKDLRFVSFNIAGEKLIGMNRSDLIGKNDYDFFPKEQADFFTEKDREVISKGALLDIQEEKLETKDKGTRLLHTKKIPILNEKGEPLYLLGISEDITEQREAAEKLREYTEAISRSNEELSQFAHTVSHDLKEPLRTIASFLTLIERQYVQKLDEQAHKYIHFVLDGAKRMNNLIEGLLEYSRVTTQGQEPKPTDLGKILETVKENLHEAISETKAMIIVDNELPVVNADEIQMMQLMQNLLSNAIKFRGTAAPVIHISHVRENGKNIITIKDNGIGIPQEAQGKLFRIFQRLHTKEEFEGTGVGLAVCKRIVERHGGKIWVESKEGEGSAFSFSLAA